MNFKSKLYLIRHAESLANTRGIYQGQTYDTGLSPLGRLQAQALASRFAGEKFDHVFASPLKRTNQTAAFFSDSCNVDPELLETNHGAWEGLHKSEVAIRWSDLYIRWQTAPADVVFPGGEAYQDTAARAVNWFNRIAKMSGTVAAVTHINIIQAIIAHILGLDPNSIQNYPIQPTGVTLIESRSPARIVYLNDFSHLKALKSDLTVHAL